jgi:hypothetical protein
MYVAPIVGGVFLLGVLAAAFDVGFFTFTIDDQQVGGRESLSVAGVAAASIGISLLASAYGIWRERSWARWAMIAFWILVLASNVGVGWSDSGLSGVARATAGMLLPIVLAVWYLFGREQVVEYYRMLELEEDAAARPKPNPRVAPN